MVIKGRSNGTSTWRVSSVEIGMLSSALNVWSRLSLYFLRMYLTNTKCCNNQMKGTKTDEMTYVLLR